MSCEYEIDFIGCNKSTKDATAICMRWRNPDGTYTVGVVDGGNSDYGEELQSILGRYYLNADPYKRIDFVICSHPHEDHATGLATILENFNVGTLYMNRPWKHIASFKANDGRITKNSMGDRLQEKYKCAAKLEAIAETKNIPIRDIFQGTIIEGRLSVLSPSKDFYLKLLAEAVDFLAKENTSFLQEAFEKIKKVANFIVERWDRDSLRENVSDSPINETSTVILGDMEDEYFLLTGDAGIRALGEAIALTNRCGFSIQEQVKIYEIPHHGGRHNLSPSILNEMIGPIVPQGVTRKKTAYVCTGKNSNHPKQMVVNAYLRRGVAVYNASGKTIHYRHNAPQREGWSPVEHLEFNSHVEDWD